MNGVSDLPSPDGARLRFSSHQHGAARVLHVEGEVDLVTAPELTRAALDQVRQAPEVLILDLADIGFLGSAGLTALLGLRDAARPRTVLRVVPGPLVRRVVQLSGLEDVLDLHVTVEDAASAE
jgi:anti-anti-sigma factor